MKFFTAKLGGALAGSIVAGAVTGFVTGGMLGYAATGTFGGFMAGATSGAIGGAISGGLFYGAHEIRAGLSGIGGVGAQKVIKVVVHGVMGGISSKLQGRSFRDGLISGAMSAMGPGEHSKYSDNTKTAIAAALGGTASHLTGGKFANGAITGAFANIFNDRNEQKAQAKECKGACHGNLGFGSRPELSEAQSEALVNAGFSSVGALASGAGCVTTGSTCGISMLMGADAVRQFGIASTGHDPVVVWGLKYGMSESQSRNMALAADLITAGFNLRAAGHAMLNRTTTNFTMGTAAIAGFDGWSSFRTADQLHNSLSQ